MTGLRLEYSNPPLRCSAFKGILTPRSKNRKRVIICEKPALHGFGCLLTSVQKEHSEKEPGLGRIYRHQSKQHAGRDSNGKWYFWTREG